MKISEKGWVNIGFLTVILLIEFVIQKSNDNDWNALILRIIQGVLGAGWFYVGVILMNKGDK